jgi:hypothetical protein
VGGEVKKDDAATTSYLLDNVVFFVPGSSPAGGEGWDGGPMKLGCGAEEGRGRNHGYK